MKRLFTVFLALGLVLGFANATFAQKKSKEERKKEKAEKKAWKKRAKGYVKDPFQLRTDLENLQKQNKELASKNADLLKRITKCNSSVDSLQSLYNSKLNEIAAMNTKYEKLQAAYEAQKNVNTKGIIPGLVYKVQIGAFVHFDINSYLKDTEENFEGESGDGMNKYTMGNFRELAVAEAFMKDVQKMGIKDAWVVPYIDGVRVTYQEARDYLEKQGS